MKVIDAFLSLFKRKDYSPHPFESARAFFSSFTRHDQPSLTSPYKQSPFTYACINALARNFKRVPLRLMVGDPDGDNDRVDNHEIMELLKRPNPITSKARLLERFIKHRFLTGACYWLLLDRSGQPVSSDMETPAEIWPFPADRFQKIRSEDGFGIAGWRFKKSHSESINLAPHQVIAFRFEDPTDALEILAPLSAALIPISQHYEMDKWNEALFRNAATPEGIVSLEGGISPEQKNQIEEAWRDKHEGSWNKFKTAFLQWGAKWTKTSDNHKDMQFLEGKADARKLTQVVFGVNDYELGLPQDVNRATALAFKELLFTTAVIPEQAELRDELNPYVERWTAGGRYFVAFDNSGVEALKQGYTDKLAQAKELRSLGFSLRQINERLELGMSIDELEAELADLHLVDTGLQNMEALVALPEEDGEPEEDEEPVPPEPEEEDEEDEEEEEEPDKDAKKAGAAYWDRIVKESLDPWEKQFVAKLNRLWRELRAETLKNLAAVAGVSVAAGKHETDLEARHAFMGSDEPKILFDQKAAEKRLVKLLGPLFEKLMGDALGSLESDLGSLEVVDPNTPELVAFIEDKKLRVRRVTRTVRRQLKAVIRKAVRDKQSVQQVADRIRQTFKFASTRSQTIARTEVAGAWNGTRFLGMAEEGVEQHRWVTARDEEVRESHSECGGVVREIGKAFPNGLIHPHDPDAPAGEIINCRCLCTPVK